MRAALLFSALLLATIVPPVPTAQAWDGCVEYMYVADYHWYYVCLQPTKPTCPILWKERHGMTWTTSCIFP